MSRPADLPFCKKVQPPPPGPMKYHNTSAVIEVLNSINESFNEEETFELTCELVKQLQNPEYLKKVMNLSRDLKAKKIKSKDQDGTSSSTEVCGQRRTVDPGASLSAAKVPLICHGDLIAAADVVFFDTENVIVKGTHDPVSGDLAVVDEKGNLLFWTYIEVNQVCMYHEQLTGLNEAKMSIGLPISTVQELLKKLFTGKTFWGADSGNDVKSLQFSSKEFPFAAATNDIQGFFRDSQGKPIGLSSLSEHFLGINLQESKHSSIADARLTALCYRRMNKFKEIGMTRFSCPLMDHQRLQPQAKKGTNVKFDKCSCGKAGSSKKRKRPKHLNVITRISTTSPFDFDWVD